MAEYVLYAFELADSVVNRRSVPEKASDKPYVYVGYTSRERRRRLNEHRVGRFAADKKWARHYVRARPDLYRLWPTYSSQDEALAGEDRLAGALRRQGYTVVNRTGHAIRIRNSAAT